MTHDKRDKAIEAWLRRPQHEVRASEVEECPDEETVAAWLEGGLEGQALDRMLTHASMCERCEAIAATVLRTEAVVPATDAAADGAVPWWRRWLAWGVPLTAAATAVVALAVWVRTPVVPSSRTSTPSAATEGARGAADRPAAVPGGATPAADAASGTTASGAPQPAKGPEPSGSRSEPLADARANTSQQVTSPSPNSKDAGVPPSQAARAAGFAERNETRESEPLSKSASEVAARSEQLNTADEASATSGGPRDRALQPNNALARRGVVAPGGVASQVAPAAPATVVAAPPTGPAPQVAAAAPPPPQPPPQSAPRPPQPSVSAAAGSSTADSAAARGGATVALPAATPVSGDPAATGAAASPATGAAALASRVDAETAWTVVMSSTNRSLWRYRGREVERSLDGGASWRRVTGSAPGVLLSGVSVSESVSWYVGERGTVLLVTEGRSTTVPFPQRVDLVSVRATSGLAAAVTTRDGRVFTTSDGGRTWRTP